MRAKRYKMPISALPTLEMSEKRNRLRSKFHKSKFAFMKRRKRQLKPGQFTLNPVQVARIINSAESPRDRLIIKLLALAGLRRAEVAALAFENIDLDHGRLVIEGKGGKTRHIPLPLDLIQELVFWTNKKSGYLFPGRSGGTLHPVTINGVLMRAAFIAGIKNPDPQKKNLNPHCLRHSYARTLKNRGVSLEALGAVLGHSSARMTIDHYGLKSSDEIDAEIRSCLEPKQ